MRDIEQLTKVATNRIWSKIKDMDPHDFFVGHSGGKDSMTVFDLTKKALELNDEGGMIRQLEVVHNVKTNINQDTLIHLYLYVGIDHPIHYVPATQMGEWLGHRSYSLEIDGTREAEFDRKDKSTTLIVDGKDVNRRGMGDYVENGIFGLNLLYPIYDWSDEEVFAYLEHNKIQLSPEYRFFR